MKKIIIFTLALFSFGMLSAQDGMSLEELKAKKAEVQAKFDAATAEATAAQGELDALQKEINMLSGWITGLSGLVGFNLSGSEAWIGNPNPTSTSTSLGLGLTAFANKEQPKYFWNNKLIANKAWQKVDIDGNNDSELFDNGTVDLLNVSSLYGYKLSEKIAISALGEFNSSIGNFLEPATLDIGAGITWRPIANLTAVIHPLNYHIAWSSQDNVDSQGALGAKIRVDYQNEFSVSGRKLAWSSTLTSFLPYDNVQSTLNELDEFGAETGETREAGLFEWTWLNTVSFQVFKGVGVGLNLGFRGADFEYPDVQTLYGMGLTYTM